MRILLRQTKVDLIMSSDWLSTLNHANAHICGAERLTRKHPKKMIDYKPIMRKLMNRTSNARNAFGIIDVTKSINFFFIG